jgi:hypothetical protein
VPPLDGWRKLLAPHDPDAHAVARGKVTPLGRSSTARLKVKRPDWKRSNVGRHKLFEGQRKPELTKAEKTLAKKREELARVLEQLRTPGLRQGVTRELRKQVAILELEIAELGQG